MEMTGGGHLLCITQIMKKTLNNESEDEANVEK